jgi:hypothetical protein
MVNPMPREFHEKFSFLPMRAKRRHPVSIIAIPSHCHLTGISWKMIMAPMTLHRGAVLLRGEAMETGSSRNP